MKIELRAALLSLLAAATPFAAAAGSVPVPPKPEHFVTDGSGVLKPETVRALEDRLQQLERETSTQLLVWIAPRIPEGTTPEELGAEAIRAWGVGQKGKDNGAVFFVFTEDRKTRIATGYGLEGVLPDAGCKRILAEVVRPALKRGDYDAGVTAGVEAIWNAVHGEFLVASGTAVSEPSDDRSWVGIALWVATLAYLAVALYRRSFVMGLLGIIVGALIYFIEMTNNPGQPPHSQFFFLGAGGVLAAVVGWKKWFTGVRSTVARASGSWDSSSSSSWSDSSSSSSSDSSSSSSFDSGGGDSGGGGSSDSF